jgi:uncharacterized membrane protein
LANSIEEYIEQLRAELAGSDPALIQDALYDAEEFLRSELEQAGDVEDREAVLAGIIERYGSPSEVAGAYRESESQYREARTLPAPVRTEKQDTLFYAVFGVVVDPQAYAALFYMMLSMLTGIIYFTWAVTGISLSLGLIILIIGIPFMLLFLATTRAISLVEGWIVEALLGVRMPRRPRLISEQQWWDRIKFWLADYRTWTTILYMVLMLPLGILYFTLSITLLCLGLGLIAAPFAQILFDYPVIWIDTWGGGYYMEWWLLPFALALGVMLIIGTLHLAKGIGKVHGQMAKALLVGSL